MTTLADLRTPREAVLAGTTALGALQRGEGNWSDFKVFNVPGIEWITGFVLLSLARQNSAPGWNAKGLPRARSFLHNSQRGNGGWGYHPTAPADADSTATCLRALLATGPADVATDKAADLLESWIEADGVATYPSGTRGIPTGSGYAKPSDCVTANVVLALHAAGRETGALVATLLRRGGGTEGWSSYWWEGHTYLQAIAVQALATAAPDNPAAREMIHRTARRIEEEQRPNGAWCIKDSNGNSRDSAFETAMALCCLAAAGLDNAARLAALVSFQGENGIWPNEAVMRVPALSAKAAAAHPPLASGQTGVFATAAALMGVQDMS
ncbi:hypothetical protein SAMN05421759_11142 [Roseivivax lentus]|uniref:Prenyltransferase and squalene oxidase repeat-containing protein n=1 Tax=Roseivivax lentus TaxID=633194 RepID=A0A1N7NYQ2_9RHOB|nr:prenyltransferase/squalene oxidase repeat-containing protein [Roseivivax lentus]SIT03477.1 hypothetical protein SAMN05421759_11142 [Roseivivax lentus]